MGLGFLFPGQGAQVVGMVGDIGAVDPAVSGRFEEASDALGFDLGDIVENGPAERLNQTEVTQPALLTSGVALLDVWRRRGGAEPEVVAGHSLGEYSALVAAGSLEFASRGGAGARARQADAGCRSRRTGRDGGDPGSRRRGGRGVLPGDRRHGHAGKLQLSRPGGHCRRCRCRGRSHRCL